TTSGQPGVAVGVFQSLGRSSVHEPIQLDVQLGLQTEEVENVRAKRVLSAKLVMGKSAIAQPAPHELLGPSVVLAHHTRDADQLGVAHKENVKEVLENSQDSFDTVNSFPLTPSLSPGERENGSPSVGESKIAGSFAPRALPSAVL